MIEGEQIRLFDMVMGLSNAIDLVSITVNNHHKRVAYIASAIAAQLGLSREAQENVLMGGAVHDIGAMFLNEEIDSMGFETGSAFKHAEIGYFLLKSCKSFSAIAPLVRYHHFYWNNGSGDFPSGVKVPLGGHIIHLADRVEVKIENDKEILGQVNNICEYIKQNTPKMFKPDLVEAFLELAQKEDFWLEVVSSHVDRLLVERSRVAVDLNMEDISELAILFSYLIDFRSRFTAVHSSGVAAIAEALAGYLDWPEHERKMIWIAGKLHDLGKLAVPLEILEKPAKLTESEFDFIKIHTFYTKQILSSISKLKQICNWASFHHERLDGQGYPFHKNHEQLCLGTRIMAVADVFTAITEDRPYRKGMTNEAALQVLQGMADNKAIDLKLVAVLKANYSELEAIRIEAQKAATHEYQKFTRKLNLISRKSLDRV